MYTVSMEQEIMNVQGAHSQQTARATFKMILERP